MSRAAGPSCGRVRLAATGLAVCAILTGAGSARAATTLMVTNGLALRLESLNVDGQNNATLTNGQRVASWTDLSGSGNHHTNTIATNRPVLIKGALGPQAIDVVEFGSRRLDRLGMSYSSFTGLSVFAVARRNATATSSPAVGVNGGGGIDEWGLRQYSSTAGSWEFKLNNSAASPKLTAVNTLGQYVLLAATYTGGPDQAAALRMTRTNENEYTYAPEAVSVATGSVAWGSFPSTRDSYLGSLTAGHSNTLAAVLIYNRALDSDEVAAVETYLNDRYLSDGRPAGTLAATPPRGPAPLVVSLDASGIRATRGASIVSYAWNFGDGAVTNGGTARPHVYRRAGSYTASVRATDNEGRTNTIYSAPIVVPPVDDASLALWLDGGNIDKQRNEKLTNHQPVAAWLDLSGRTNDFIQATVASRPTLGRGLLGPQARDVLSLTNRSLSKTMSHTNFTGISVFAVARRSAPDYYSWLIGAVGNNWRLVQYSNEADSWQWGVSNSVTPPSPKLSGYAIPEWVLLSGTYNCGTLQNALLRMTRTNATASVAGGVLTCPSFPLNVAVRIGGAHSNTIAETLIYGRELSTGEVAIVEGYLIRKYFRPAPVLADDLPAITAHPANTGVNEGAPAGFVVTARGLEPLFYQWQRNGTNVGGATGAVLSIPAASSADAGAYRCLVSNVLDIVTSAVATLTVNLPPACLLTSPTAGAGFTAGYSIPLAAAATDPDDGVARVDFYAGTNLLGTDLAEPYELTWGGVPAGAHNLTARATDPGGMVTVSAPVAVTVTNAAQPVLCVTATDALAAEPGSTNAYGTGTYRITRHGPVDTALTVKYAMSGTASNGADYTTLNGTATIAAGSSNVTVTVTAKSDGLVEEATTATLTLSADAAYRVGDPSQATVWIHDSDYATPAVKVVVTDIWAGEPGQPDNYGTATFQLQRTGSLHTSLTVNVSVCGTALRDTDYTLAGYAGGTATIPASASTLNLAVTALADALLEGNESVVLTVQSGGADYAAGTPATGMTWIADGNTAPGTARFIRSDAATHGSWKGRYGGDGAYVPADFTNYPAYGSWLMRGSVAGNFGGQSDTPDFRALRRAAGTNGIYSAHYGNAFTNDVHLTDGQVHALSVYCLDKNLWYENVDKRWQRLELRSGADNTLLDAREVGGPAGLPFKDGVWLTWWVSGHVRLVMQTLTNQDCRLNGVFVDPAISNRPPVANADSYATVEDVALSVAAPGLLANDTDPDFLDTNLTAVLWSQGTLGVVSLGANGGFVYAPHPHANGTDRFTYRARDPDGLVSGVATVTVTIAAVGDAPMASFDANPPAGPAPLTVALDGSASSDADGDTLRFAWDFGDGTTGAGMSTGHTYAADGHYTVVMAVSDGSVTATAVRVITVAAGATGGEQPPPEPGGIVTPPDNPALPGGMPSFDPGSGVGGGVPPDAAPQIAEWTRTARPDDTITLSGWQLSRFSGADEGRDTRFRFYGQTAAGNGVWAEGLIQSIGRDKATVTLPTNLPPGSAYLVWPGNAAGWGYPARINMAEAWWVGPEYATRGDLVGFFGRNLVRPGATNAWVWLKPETGGNGQWAEVQPAVPAGADYAIDASNPYMLKFRVPPGLANGIHRVWAHNGGGGAYGWSPGLTFEVNDGLTWTLGSTYNVRSYGALGNGTTDDTVALSNAMAAADAADWSTVYFPTGTYIISRPMKIGNRMRLLGDGRDRSLVKLKDNGPYTTATTFWFAGDEVETRGLTLDCNGPMQPWVPYPYGGGVNFQSRRMIRFMDCRIDVRARTMNCGDGTGVWNLLMRDTQIMTQGSFWFSRPACGLFFEGCDFYQGRQFLNTNPGSGVTWWGATKVAISGCTFQHYGSLVGDADPDDPREAVNFGTGRWMCEQAHRGVFGNHYAGGNRSVNSVPPNFRSHAWQTKAEANASGAGTNALYAGPEWTGEYTAQGKSAWTAVTNTYPQWLRADLGSVRTVSEIHTVFSAYATLTYGYRIETSTNNVVWTNAVAGTWSSYQEYAVDAFPARPARYVRITLDACSLPTALAAIVELQAFGSGPTAPLSFTAATASSTLSGSSASYAIDGKSIRDSSAQARFAAEFTQTGTHYVWVRGRGGVLAGYLPDMLATNSDSCWVGLDDDAEKTLPMRMDGFGDAANPTAYVWRNLMTYVGADGQRLQAPLTFAVTNTGMHNLDVTICEDGFYLDKIVVATDPAYVPSGAGPAETLNGGQFRQAGGGLLAMEAEHATARRNGAEWFYNADGNVGEQIMWEVGAGAGAVVVAATAGTITLAGDTRGAGGYSGLSNGCNVVVMSGKGVGQCRYVENATFDGVNTLAFMSEPWRVIPAAGGGVWVKRGPRHEAVYANRLSGTPRIWTDASHTASVGVQFYYGASDVDIVGNTFHELRGGINFFEPRDGPAPYTSILVAGNTFEKTRWTVYSGQPGDTPNGRMLNVTRGNTFGEAAIDAVSIKSAYGSGGHVELDAEVYEHNVFTNAPIAVEFAFQPVNQNNVGHVLFYRNTLALGSAAYAGSAAWRAIDPAGAYGSFFCRPQLRENRFSGFETNFRPAAPLLPWPTLPVRVVNVEVPQGASASATLPVWDSGAAGMEWSVASLADDWLTLTPPTGSLADQASGAAVTLTVNAAGLAVGEYEAVVELRCGFATQRATVRAVVTAGAGSGIPVVLTSQPSSLARVARESAVFAVTAIGAPPLYYRWRKDGVDIGGATGAGHGIAVTALSDAGAYRCVVSNAMNAVTSAVAVLTVAQATPRIDGWPVAGGITYGQTLAEAVLDGGVASVPGVFAYNDPSTVPSAGTYGAAVTFTPADTVTYAPVGGTVSVAVAKRGVTGGFTAADKGYDGTIAATVLTRTLSGVQAGDAGRVSLVGGSATFDTAAVGDAKTVTLSGASLSGPAADNYTLVAVATATARITLLAAPSIAVSPTNLTVNPGALANFAVTALGTAPLCYQWQKNGTNIVGATGAGYGLAAAEADEGTHRCVVTNMAGSAESASATLTVNDAPGVTLTSPTNGSVFQTGVAISLESSASDGDGEIANVAFYQGGVLLKTATNAPYTHTWIGAGAGVHGLVAVATDNGGLAATSAVVTVTVSGVGGTSGRTPPITLPFIDTFDVLYADGQILDGTNGWETASEEAGGGAYVSNGVGYQATMGVVLEARTALSNRCEDATATKVWIETYMKPSFSGDKAHPFSANWTVQMYVNANGYIVVAQTSGGVTNWIPLLTDAAGASAKLSDAVYTNIGLALNYETTPGTFAVWLGGRELTNGLIMNSANAHFETFKVYSGGATTLLDNVTIRRQAPPLSRGGSLLIVK